MEKQGGPRRGIPDSIAQVRTILKFEFRNYLRGRRFFVLTAITLIISGLLTAVVGYYRPPNFTSSQLSFYSGWWSQFASFVIVLAGIFFGGDAISGEFQNKTGYFLLPNPLRRSSIYVGKWLAAYIASAMVIGIFALLAMANAFFYFGASVPVEFGESFLFALFYLAAVLGFTFFFSSLVKSSSISILVTVILFFFVFNILETLVSTLAHVEAWFILTYGYQIVSNILTVPYPTHARMIPAGPNFSVTLYAVTVPEGLAIMGAYFVATAILGLLLFERKEFT